MGSKDKSENSAMGYFDQASNLIYKAQSVATGFSVVQDFQNMSPYVLSGIFTSISSDLTKAEELLSKYFEAESAEKKEAQS